MVINYQVITNDAINWPIVASEIGKKDWAAAKYLSNQMRMKRMEDWECVLVAYNKENIIAFCSLVKKDIAKELKYTPYIATVFVDPAYRGNKISEKLIKKGEEQLQRKGFKKSYILSQLDDFYEKKGYQVIGNTQDIFGRDMKIFEKSFLK